MDDSLITGKVVQVSQSPHGSLVFFIVAGATKPFLKRGKFFAHEGDFPSRAEAAATKVGDMVRFLPCGPDKPRQLPHTKSVSRVER